MVRVCKALISVIKRLGADARVFVLCFAIFILLLAGGQVSGVETKIVLVLLPAAVHSLPRQSILDRLGVR